MRIRLLLVAIFILVICGLSNGSAEGPDSAKKEVQKENTESSSEANKDPVKNFNSPPDDGKEKKKSTKKRPEPLDLTKLNSKDLIHDQTKVLQKMIDEMDVMKSTILDDPNLGLLGVEELPPLPAEFLNQPPLTPEQLEAQALFNEASELLNRTKPDKIKAYKLLLEASEKGSHDAEALVAWARLFGNPLKQDIKEAARMFFDLAEVGHPDGHTGLGFLYTNGFGLNVSQARALVHYTFGAIGGNPWAQIVLGYKYWSGINVATSCETALDYYRQVADKVSEGISFGGGAAIQRIRLMDELENGFTSGILDNDLIEYYQLLAEKGDTQAQVGLGQLHYQGGRGVDLDYQKALHYFSLASNAGNAVAKAYLGKIYLDGSDEVKANNATAFKYFKEAADLNNPVGQSGLGLMYLYGMGVEKDYAVAHKYFLAAADQGWVDGQLHLGNMYLNGLGVRKDYKLANKYFSLASQSGHVLAYYNLGLMHAQGTGLLRSCPTAVELFKNVAERGRWGELLMQAHSDYREGRHNEAFIQYALLAELGYEVAQSNAAFMLDKEEVPMMGKREGLVRALVYWGRAAAQGYSTAQVKLGDYHYYGLGTPVDYETAATHYRIASEQQHNAQAMFNLGYMHEQGLGMVRDIHLAKRCYDLAAETNADAKVPVALALLKLNLIFSWESFQQSKFSRIFDAKEMITANWDLYLITLLSATLALIVYFRRPQVQVRH